MGRSLRGPARHLPCRSRQARGRHLRHRHRAARPLVVRGARLARARCSRRRRPRASGSSPSPRGSSWPSRPRGRSRPSTWGTGKDFTTWDSPAVARAGLRRPRGRAAGPWRRWRPHGAPHAALERAARELLAMQASDWSFMVTRDLAADYPLERMRAARGFSRRRTGRSDRLRGRSGPVPARAGASPRPLSAHDSLDRMRVLILSWEYPPLIEGGLARHVRKLAENMAAQGVDVHVLARGREEDPAEEVCGGVIVHRVREPERPRDLSEFVAWIEHMNSDMLAAGVEVGDRYDFDVVHGHDWLVASAGDHLAKRFRAPLVVTIHATEYGRHQGWVEKHPQSYIHGVERWMANRAERADHLLLLHARARGRHLRARGEPRARDPQRDRPVGARAGGRPRHAALPVRRTGREAGAAGGPARVREGLPARARGAARADRADREGALHRGRVRAPPSSELREQATALGLDDHGTFLGWIGDDVLHSLYRIADLTVVPSIYEPFGLVALEAMASGCPCLVADTGGLREVVPNEDVGLRFRSRDPRSLGHDGRAPPDRRRAARPARGRGLRARADASTGPTWPRQVAAVYRDVTPEAATERRGRPLRSAPSMSAGVPVEVRVLPAEHERSHRVRDAVGPRSPRRLHPEYAARAHGSSSHVERTAPSGSSAKSPRRSLGQGSEPPARTLRHAQALERGCRTREAAHDRLHRPARAGGRPRPVALGHRQHGARAGRRCERHEELRRVAVLVHPFIAATTSSGSRGSNVIASSTRRRH